MISYRRKEATKHPERSVLILIVVEDDLVPDLQKTDSRIAGVLILIVVEDDLVLLII